jgi:hypothetical protein
VSVRCIDPHADTKAQVVDMLRDLLARAEGGEFVSAIFLGQRTGNSFCYRNTGSPDRHAQIAALEIEKAILVQQLLTDCP